MRGVPAICDRRLQGKVQKDGNQRMREQAIQFSAVILMAMKHPFPLLLSAVATLLGDTAAQSQIQISEFLANNVTGLRDETNEH